MKAKAACLACVLFIAVACSPAEPQDPGAQLDRIGEQQVRLSLALGEHDSDYVDAYFGPEEWRVEAKQQAKSLPQIAADADRQVAALEAMDLSGASELLVLRHNYLLTHLRSLATVSRVRDGLTLSFDEESRRIYGFVAPSFPEEHYAAALQRLNAVLPGDGPTHARYQAFQEQFRIPDDKVEAVVRKGLEACRAVTLQNMTLPEGEDFELEFVTGQPWGAYNWYQGDGQGLIQVNIGRPKRLGTSIRLGCHEGYPGHHTYSSLLDHNFLQDRGWVEFSVLALFSPQAIIFEGSGDLAANVAFPGNKRTAFLRDTILPIAGLDSPDLDAQQEVRGLLEEMRYVGIEAARNYLDGAWSREQTEDWLTRYALVGPEDMGAWFGFTERYRAYRINYVLGEDLVASFVRNENPDGDEQGDWQALEKLLSLPPAPMLFSDGLN